MPGCTRPQKTQFLLLSVVKNQKIKYPGRFAVGCYLFNRRNGPQLMEKTENDKS